MEILNTTLNFVADVINFFGGANLTAFLALFVSIYTVYSTRKHNKLSVRPYLTSNTHYYLNKNEAGITIRNCGAGTAYIESFSILFDNREISFSDLNDRILPSELKGVEYDFDAEYIAAIPPNESFKLIYFEFPDGVKDKKTYLILDRFSATIKYQCGYEKVYKFNPDHIRKISKC